MIFEVPCLVDRNMAMVLPSLRKPAYCICKNKDADKLGGNHSATDQHLCFCYLPVDSTIPLLLKYKITSF